MFSPGGFSPPPMEDTSPTTDLPPPMGDFECEDEDEEDEEDEEFDNSFDLTGLSDKINTIEFDKISSLPPREILEMKKEKDQLNNMYANNLNIVNKALEAKEDIKEDDTEEEIEAENESIETLDSNKSNNNDDDLEEELVEEKRVIIEEAEVEEKKVIIEEKKVIVEEEKVIVEEEEVLNKKQEENQEDDLEDMVENSSHREKLSDELLEESEEQVEAECDEEEIEEEKNVCEEETENLSDLGTSGWNAFPSEKEDSEKDEVGWGDFGETVKNEQNGHQEGGWGSFEDDRTTLGEKEQEEEDEFDDDFGDFGAAENRPTAVVVVDQGLSQTLTLIRGDEDARVRDLLEHLKHKEDEEGKVTVVLEEEVLVDKEVWESLQDPASSPGLEYQWKGSNSYNTVLNTLGIDARGVLDGETWRSSVRSASTLLTPGLLTPTPTSSSFTPTNKEETDQLEWDEEPSTGLSHSLSLLDLNFFATNISAAKTCKSPYLTNHLF